MDGSLKKESFLSVIAQKVGVAWGGGGEPAKNCLHFFTNSTLVNERVYFLNNANVMNFELLLRSLGKWANLPELQGGNLGDARKKASFFEDPSLMSAITYVLLTISKTEPYPTNDRQTSIPLVLPHMQSKSTIQGLRTLSSYHIQHAFIIPSDNFCLKTSAMICQTTLAKYMNTKQVDCFLHHHHINV